VFSFFSFPVNFLENFLEKISKKIFWKKFRRNKLRRKKLTRKILKKKFEETKLEKLMRKFLQSRQKKARIIFFCIRNKTKSEVKIFLHIVLKTKNCERKK